MAHKIRKQDYVLKKMTQSFKGWWMMSYGAEDKLKMG